MLESLQQDLIASLQYLPGSKPIDKIQSKENRESAQNLITVLSGMNLNKMEEADIKKMIKTLLQNGKINNITLSPMIAKRCARQLLRNYKDIIAKRVQFTEDASGLDAFKELLKRHLLSASPEKEREFLADNIARSFHQSGIMYATPSYFILKLPKIFEFMMAGEKPTEEQNKFVQSLKDPSEKRFTLKYENGSLSVKATTAYSEILTMDGGETRHAVLKRGRNFVEIDSKITVHAVDKENEPGSLEMKLTPEQEPLTIRKALIAKNGKRVPFFNTFLSLLCDDPLSGKNGIYLLDHKPSVEKMQEMATYLYFDGPTLKYCVKDADGPIEGTVPTNKLDIGCLKKMEKNNNENISDQLDKMAGKSPEKSALIDLLKAAKALEEPAPKKQTGFLGFIKRAWAGEASKKKNTATQPKPQTKPPGLVKR